MQVVQNMHLDPEMIAETNCSYSSFEVVRAAAEFMLKDDPACKMMASALRSQHLASCLTFALVRGRGFCWSGSSRTSATALTLGFLQMPKLEPERFELPLLLLELAGTAAAFRLEARSTDPIRMPS